MRKILMFVFACIITAVSFLYINRAEVYADEQYIVENIDAVIEIAEDTEYNGINFVVGVDVNTVKSFDIISGTLTLNNCKFSSLSTAPMDTIFNIGENGKLILNDVIFEDIKYNQCIVNRGILELKEVSFVDGSKSIIHDSKEPIRYYSGNLENIEINSGYISVFESTVVTDDINVKINNFADMTLVVRGEGNNVFASKYMNFFKYRDNSATSADDEYYLDYIGDYDSSVVTVTDASGKISLNSGDIVLTTMNMEFTDKGDENYPSKKVTYAPMYCTSNNYLNSEYDRWAQGGDEPVALYKSNGLARTLDNYSANTNSTAKFNAISRDGNMLTLTVNCVDAENGTILSTTQTTYLSGMNMAIFVDITNGYEFDTEDPLVEFTLKNGTATNVVGLGSVLPINNYYMRPIIEFKSTTYSAYNIIANFAMSRKINYASVSVVSDGDVEITKPANMEVGNSYEFSLTCASDEIISEVKFNGEDVDFVELDNVYTFSAVVLENNSVDVKVKKVLNITPAPSKLTFEYGDTIELKQSYTISNTESIEIEYVASKTALGSYSITEIKSCSTDDYVINIVGDVKYTVVQKRIDLTTIKTKTYTVNYSNNMDITYDKFLVEGIASYLEPSLQLPNDYVKGEQTLRLYFTLKSENYIITNVSNYINVTLNVLPDSESIDINDFTFNDVSKEYTGSAITVLVAGHNAQIVNVEYEYYRKDDLSTNIGSAIDVGEYVVKAIFSSLSDLYVVSGSRSAELVITPQNVNMESYLTAIEVTEFEYDGQSKYIDYKENLLPAQVVISSIDSVYTQKDANIYYYTIYFEPVSNNYTCVESARVALVINPKVVTVALVSTQFDYTGAPVNLVAEIDGVILGDVVTPIYETTPQASVGTHKIKLLRLSNTNYTFVGTVEFTYTINAISVDMTGVKFENVTATYDGNSHMPVLTGVLPLGITYEIDDTDDCINAGTYNIECTFSSSQAGVIAPASMFASVVIAQKELLVVFNEPSNMIANGDVKNITIELEGVVEGDVVNYDLNYSNVPIVAGEYTCRVDLVDSPNYVLKSNAPYRFYVYMNSISLTSDGININVIGKFSSDENLNVSKINNSVEIVNLLSKMSIKNYVALNFSCVAYSSELMTVNMNGDVIGENLKYVKAYRVVDNKLEEIEYKVTGNSISFKSNCNEKIILVEEYSYLHQHYTHINFIVASAIACLILILIIAMFDVVSKKKTMNSH